MKGIPIYESRDEGTSWQPVTHATDTARGDDSGRCNLHWQPHLMEMPRTVRSLAAGTILLSASMVLQRRARPHGPAILSGSTVRPILAAPGSIAARSFSGTADQPVWEPNLRLLDDGKLVTYYSTGQHKPEGFNQLLAYKVSTDAGELGTRGAQCGLPRWGRAARHGDRRSPADGRYVLSYESVDGPTLGDKVHIKFSKDGLDWGAPSDRGVPVQAAWRPICRKYARRHLVPGGVGRRRVRSFSSSQRRGGWRSCRPILLLEHQWRRRPVVGGADAGAETAQQPRGMDPGAVC